jgi:hypothetical protein
MAPLHHHFQFLGWSENKIVTRFWIVSVLCALIGLGALKMNRGQEASEFTDASDKIQRKTDSAAAAGPAIHGLAEKLSQGDRG